MTANFVMTALWLVIWGYELIILAAVNLAAVALTNVIGTGLLAKSLAQDSQRLKLEQPKLYW